ncbi:MAG: hypothetical protein ACRD82_07270 [Blastocatellia bacterium]
MKSNVKEIEMAMNEVELEVEMLEEVIAPALIDNHNETVEVDLSVEELEEVIAPGIKVPQ